MPDDWENLVIETGVDSLLNYLAENKKASTSEISKEIGVDESRVKEWADGLSDENLIEKHHTLTSGLVLEYTDENLKESEKKKDEIQSDLNRRSTQLRMKLEEEAELDNEKRKELFEEKDELEEKEKDVAVDDTVERLKSIQSRIEEKTDSNDLDEETLELINEAERLMRQVEKLVQAHLTEKQGKKLNQEMDQVVSDVRDVMQVAKSDERYKEEEQQIRKEVKVLTKLDENIAKARQRDKQSGGLLSKILPIERQVEVEDVTVEDIEDEEDNGGGIGRILKGVLPIEKEEKDEPQEQEQESQEKSEEKTKENQVQEKEVEKPQSEDQEEDNVSIEDHRDNSSLHTEITGKIRKGEVPEETYQELVDENKVTEVMRKISLIKNPDYQALKQAEENNRNRADLVNYLEERIEDGR